MMPVSPIYRRVRAWRRRWTGLIFALIVGALLDSVLLACGNASRDAGSPSRVSSTATGAAGTGAAAPGSYLKGDDDADEGVGSPDADDGRTRGYGHAANAADEHAVTALVKRYYAAGAMGDGATACRLMSPRLAGEPNLGDAAEEAYPPAPSAPSLHGKSCVQIMSLLFREDHRRLTADRATLYVIAVRIDGLHGLTLLGFRASPERQIPIVREGHAWKIDSLLDLEIV